MADYACNSHHLYYLAVDYHDKDSRKISAQFIIDFSKKLKNSYDALIIAYLANHRFYLV